MNGVKKNIVEQMREDGALDRINILLSASYLCISLASIETARAELVIERYGMKLGRIKRMMNHLEGAFTLFTREFASMIHGEENRQGWITDVSEFEQLFHQWQGIPTEWHEGEPQYVDMGDIIIKSGRNKEKHDGKTNNESEDK